MTLKEGLEQLNQSIIERIQREQREKGIRASGRSADSLRSETTFTTGKIFGEDYFENQEKGTPTGSKVTVQEIRKWTRQKGISADPTAIWRKLVSEGSSLYRKLNGGERSRFHNPKPLGLIDIINEETPKIQRTIADISIAAIRSEILEEFRNIENANNDN